MGGVTAFLKRELSEVAAVTGYFLAVFLIISVITQLYVLEFGVRFSVLARCAVGALIVGKVVVVLEHTSMKRWFASWPVYLNVLMRSVLYTAAVVLVVCAEMVFHGYRDAGSLSEGFAEALHEAALSRGLAKMILLFTSFVGYGLLSELARTVGRSRMMRFLFGRTDAEATPPP